MGASDKATSDLGPVTGRAWQRRRRKAFRRRALLELALVVLCLGYGSVVVIPVAPVFAVDPAGIELEIESTIEVTTLNASAVVDGVTRANGRIRLEPGGSAGTWQGKGELQSTTSSGEGGCGSLHIEGTGTYDWVVREAVVAPGIEAERIVVHMDAGPTVESPDKADLDACTAIIGGTFNTWENIFFIVHNADYGAKGLEVRGWSLQVQGEGWEDGQLIATASWAGACGDGFLIVCHEETVFRLYALGGTSALAPGSASPTPSPTASTVDTGAGGGLAVATVDRAGAVLTLACVELWTDAGGGSRGTLVPESERCDTPVDLRGEVGVADGRVDGSLGWASLAPGGYLVVATLPPTDVQGGPYQAAPDTPVTISAGEVSRLTLHHDRRNALTILKVDAAGAPLSGACFAIGREGSGGRTIGPTGSAACDDEAPASPGTPAGDGQADGILVLPSNDLTLTGATYTLVEVKSPDGYVKHDLQTVELAPDRATVLTITNDTGAILVANAAALPSSPATQQSPATPLAPIAATACQDVLDCAATYWPIVLGLAVGSVLLVVLGTQVVLRRTISIEPVPSPTLNATGGLDPAMTEISVGDGGLDLDKVAPTEPLLDKMAPTDPLLDKMAPTEPLLDKMAPTEPVVEKWAPSTEPMVEKMAPTEPVVEKWAPSTEPMVEKIAPELDSLEP